VIPTRSQGIGSPETSLETQKKEWLDLGFTNIVKAVALATVGILVWMVFVVYHASLPAVNQFGWAFITSKEWDVPNLMFGALPYIYGTLVSSAIAFVFAVPVGLAVALITSEDIVPRWVQTPLAFLVELIAAIPSVIIGLWGIFVFLPSIEPLTQLLHRIFSWIPLFSTPPQSIYSMLSAGIILAIMITPTVASISRDVLVVLPQDLRSASVALGATRWETIFKVMLPTGVSGIVGAAILALGRALGETMAVTMVIGNSANISPSLLNPGYTIPAVIANEFGEALEPVHVGSFMYLAMILFVLTLVVNLVAVVLVQLTAQKA
jgi:phosphate transport system permease protein